MLTELSINNFKSLRDTGKLKLKPITFLVGPNSSGKSSVFQAILALRQTIRNKERKFALILQDYVDLGSFKDIVWQHCSENRITIKLSDSTNCFEFEFAYYEPNESIVVIRYRDFGISSNGNFDYEVIRNQEGNYTAKIYNYGNLIEKEYKIEFLKFYQIKNIIFDENKEMANILEKSKTKKFKPNKKEKEIIDKAFNDVLNNFNLKNFCELQEQELVKVFDQILHICPLRRESQRGSFSS